MIIRGLTETTNSDEIRKNEDKFYVNYSTGEIFFNQSKKLESFDVEEYYVKTMQYIDYSMVTVGESVELGRAITLKEFLDNGEFTIGTGGGVSGSGSGENARITSTFSQTSCTSNETLHIEYFYNSPNVGNGTLYVSVNNKEVIKESIPQGKGTIELNNLSKGTNVISIYVVDNEGLYTNELNYKVNCGLLEISSSFNFEKDYQVSSIIKFPFTLNTIVETGIIVHFEFNGKYYTVTLEKQTILYNKLFNYTLQNNHNLLFAWHTNDNIDVEWNYNEVMNFMKKMNSYIDNLICQQRNYEEQIKNCKTKEEISNIKEVNYV